MCYCTNLPMNSINPNTLTHTLIPKADERVCPGAPHKPKNKGYDNPPNKTFKKLEQKFNKEI